MKKITKILGIAALLVAALAFTSCDNLFGSKDSDTDSSTKTDTDTSTKTEEALTLIGTWKSDNNQPIGGGTGYAIYGFHIYTFKSDKTGTLTCKGDYVVYEENYEGEKSDSTVSKMDYTSDLTFEYTDTELTFTITYPEKFGGGMTITSYFTYTIKDKTLTLFLESEEYETLTYVEE